MTLKEILTTAVVVLMIAVVYYMVDSQRRQAEKKLKEMRENLKVDDKVVTFSGLAGVLLVTGTFGYGRVILAFENYGFDGIAVALIGGNTAIGSLFGGLLLAALKAAQPLMSAKSVPDSIAVIISSLIIIFII